MLKFNHIIIGILGGLIMPLLTYPVIKYLFDTIGNLKYITIEYLLGMPSLLAKIVTLCLVGNLVLFLIFMKFEKDKSAKGVIATTFVYGILILILKLK